MCPENVSCCSTTIRKMELELGGLDWTLTRPGWCLPLNFALVSNMGRHLLPSFSLSNYRARPMKRIITNFLLLAEGEFGCLHMQAKNILCMFIDCLHLSDASTHYVWLLALAVFILVHVVWLHTFDMIKT